MASFIGTLPSIARFDSLVWLRKGAAFSKSKLFAAVSISVSSLSIHSVRLQSSKLRLASVSLRQLKIDNNRQVIAADMRPKPLVHDLD